MKKLAFISTLLAALAAAAPAAAQDDDEADETDEAGTDAGTAGTAEAAGDEPAAGDAPAASAEETIYVVQGKPFLVAGKFEIAPQILQSVNDSFTSHTGALISGIYHLKENVAFEVAAGGFGWWDIGGPRLGGRDSELTVELREKESLAPERVKLYQFPWLVAADAQWSPFYGKVSFQDFALGQFNLYLSVGASVFGLQLESLTQNGVQKAFVDLPNTFGVLPAMALSTTFGGGLRFYFTEWLGVRIEVRDYVIPLAVREAGPDAVEDADGPSFDVTNLVLGQAGVSFVF
jgi:outer membrane beta-barrel protein